MKPAGGVRRERPGEIRHNMPALCERIAKGAGGAAARYGSYSAPGNPMIPCLQRLMCCAASMRQAKEICLHGRRRRS